MQTEKELLLALKKAREEKLSTAEDAKRASEEYNKAESRLVEYLEAQEATRTRKYDGVGYATLMKPRLFASCNKENEPMLFEFLKNISREDMITPTVNRASLSALLGERLENGEAIPECVQYFFKQAIRINE